MPTLSERDRAKLPLRAFAYIDSQGRKRLPIHDESHVRNALARFDQTLFETDDAREQARLRLIAAAKRYGIVPAGFFEGQLRRERTRGETGTPLTSFPRGTVTFLMTDIEGSTALVRGLGNRYTPLLRSVRSIIRRAVRRAAGQEVDVRADEYFAVFKETAHALEAALQVQRELSKRRWPAGSQVRLRMGLHRGRSTLTDAGYVGIAVHTTARVCNAGRGGQILLSTAARDALGASPIVRFRRLSPVRLQGLPRPEVLHRVLGGSPA
ncbi:MAG: adenylate/guanylate cyclase domain-containing protein [Thermoleophilaceae bacterium]